MGPSRRGSITKEGLGVQKHRAYLGLGEASICSKPHLWVKGHDGNEAGREGGHQIPG